MSGAAKVQRWCHTGSRHFLTTCVFECFLPTVTSEEEEEEKKRKEEKKKERKKKRKKKGTEEKVELLEEEEELEEEEDVDDDEEEVETDCILGKRFYISCPTAARSKAVDCACGGGSGLKKYDLNLM